jgi:multicomponent K+:H+ antiporter subunit G
MTTLPLWASIPASILLVLSGILTLTGSAGLLRFKRFYSRMHAPTLGNTLGVGFVLLASILVSSAIEGHIVIHQLLITFLLVIVSPVTAILLMQAGLRRDARRPVPDE